MFFLKTPFLVQRYCQSLISASFVTRLVDELVILYKEAALKIARDDIRTLVLRILILLQQ